MQQLVNNLRRISRRVEARNRLLASANVELIHLALVPPALDVFELCFQILPLFFFERQLFDEPSAEFVRRYVHGLAQVLQVDIVFVVVVHQLIIANHLAHAFEEVVDGGTQDLVLVAEALLELYIRILTEHEYGEKVFVHLVFGSRLCFDLFLLLLLLALLSGLIFQLRLCFFFYRLEEVFLWALVRVAKVIQVLLVAEAKEAVHILRYLVAEPGLKCISNGFVVRLLQDFLDF